MTMPKNPKRRYVLTVNNCDRATTRYEFDFADMTWRLARTGGYSRQDESGRIAAEAAAIFWRECPALISQAATDDMNSQVDGETWTAVIEDGQKTQLLEGSVPELGVDTPTDFAFTKLLHLAQMLRGIEI
jgi:hypothetical protein